MVQRGTFAVTPTQCFILESSFTAQIHKEWSLQESKCSEEMFGTVTRVRSSGCLFIQPIWIQKQNQNIDIGREESIHVDERSVDGWIFPLFLCELS